MDRCPPEICHLIFCFACTDGGYTGRSLSAVSKSIRSISRPTMLQSMSIIGYNQLVAFLNILEQEQAQTQQQHSDEPDRPSLRHVKYLFISAHARNTAVDPKALTPEFSRKARAYEAFERILRIIAPTIRVLHVFFIFYRTFLLLPLSLPVLQELSLHGPINCPSVNGEPSIFPALRHLHISSPFPPRYLTGKLARIAPELKHFRLSAPDHNEEFLVELQAILSELSVELEGGGGSETGAGSGTGTGTGTGMGAGEGNDTSSEDSASDSSSNSSSTSSADDARMCIFIHCPGKPQDNWMDLLNIYHRQMVALHRLAEEYKVLVKLLPPLRYSLFRTVSIQDAEVAWMQSVTGRSWWAPDYVVSNDVYVADGHT
ncbi:hypothetical protein GYMLUDRAFT_44667 [Collybiopsis luxurians FD-317 M1]|uniref:Unplaced genomic scaffold GYMLUscaffold_32, whole genome shotgun sequence n=1 Tax=Collybiopsis luxurians FD-317 M1 TaxID=944289 RepID=A0A0D0BUW3_9AGAR|nr:hypothetical protein GYMLUDRAFT_44667 [Collybiopsis luxurians FD-317 M1]